VSYAIPTFNSSLTNLQPGFLNEEEQRSLVISCLEDHSRHPNETNLDAHYEVPHDGLWELWKTDQQSSIPSPVNREPPLEHSIYPKVSLPPDLSILASSSSQKRELVDNAPSSVDTLPDLLAVPKPPPEASSALRPTPVSRLLLKMRWANLGRSYHWGTKSYDFSKKLAPFPADVRKVCQRAVRTIHWEDVWRDGTEDELIPAEEWGDEGANWSSWYNEYGRFSSI
jgi:alkylated DNA repair protein alkB family protein 1